MGNALLNLIHFTFTLWEFVIISLLLNVSNTYPVLRTDHQLLSKQKDWSNGDGGGGFL